MKTVLFDFGGTLNSDGDHWGAIFRDLLGLRFPELSVRVLEEAYVFAERKLVRNGLTTETFGETLRLQLSFQLERLGKLEEETLSLIHSELNNRTNYRMKIVKEYLEKWSKEHTLGLVSNFYGNLEAVTRAYSISQFFELQVDSSILGIRKPDENIWRHAIDTLEAEVESVVIVGDSHKNDVAPANSIGATSVWYRGKEWRPANGNEIADHTIHSLVELDDILSSVN